MFADSMQPVNYTILFYFGGGVKHNAPINKPTNTANSFVLLSSVLCKIIGCTGTDGCCGGMYIETQTNQNSFG